jgi:hypothetical protein
MTEISSINRQPNNLDYATNTQFRFLINKMPKTEFFVKSANIPGITLTEIIQPTSLSQIKIPGNDLSYEDLTIGFLIDENFDNYIEVQNWMRGLGFPESNEQFENLLKEGRDKSPQSMGLKSSTDAGKETRATADSPIFSDGTLSILSSKNNPTVEVRFRDLYPKSLSSVDFTQEATDVVYLEGTVTMGYKFYEIVKLP